MRGIKSTRSVVRYTKIDDRFSNRHAAAGVETDYLDCLKEPTRTLTEQKNFPQKGGCTATSLLLQARLVLYRSPGGLLQRPY